MFKQRPTHALLASTTFLFGLTAFVTAPIQSSEETGSLSGSVTFDGAAAPADVIVSDAVVYLMGDGLPSGPAAIEVPVLNQSDLMFSPHVLTVVAGGQVEVRNNDAVMHNVNTVSLENRALNKAQLAGMTFKTKFKRPEIVQVKCDVHSQMSAYIAVVPNRFFAQPSAEGSFTIADVPAGHYQLVGWHEKYGEVSYDVDVTEGQTVTASVNFTSS